MRAELDVSLRGGRLCRGRAQRARERARGGRPHEPHGRQPAHARAGRRGPARAAHPRVRLRRRRRGGRAAARDRWPRPRACGSSSTRSGHPGDVQADPHRLHQALTQPDRERDQVLALGRRGRASRAWRRDGEVGVTVTDRGPGIPADAREHVFDRFFRADDARGRTVGGSGARAGDLPRGRRRARRARVGGQRGGRGQRLLPRAAGRAPDRVYGPRRRRSCKATTAEVSLRDS